MRRSEIIFDAITNISEELIDQALDYRFRKSGGQWRRYLSAAACLALVVMVGFGAVRLGIFGGFGGSDNAAANTAAPESSGWDDTVTDDAAQDDTSDSPAQEPSENAGDTTDDTGDEGSAEWMTFTALILEIHDSYLLVEPVEGEWILASADRIQVPIKDMENIDQFAVGDAATITFTGGIQETYPARITDVVEILPAE